VELGGGKVVVAADCKSRTIQPLGGQLMASAWVVFSRRGLVVSPSHHRVAIYLSSNSSTIYYYAFGNQMMKKYQRAINTFSLTVKVKHIKNDTAFVL